MYYDYNEELPLFFLTDKEFFASQIFNNQTKALRQIQEIYNRCYRGKDSYEVLNIRFSCLPLNVCQLTINNQIFIDPYSYARLDNDSPLTYETPVVHIDKSEQLKSFQILEDHFRYIWNHPTTLFYEDCTRAYFDKDSSNKLVKLQEIKIPNEVNFNHKINRLRSRFLNTNDEKLKRWQFQVESMFRSMTRMIETTPESEAVFVGFSFDNGKKLAGEIINFLNEDFKGCLKLNIVNLREGNDPLYPELIRQMKASTIALIFLQKIFMKKKKTKSITTLILICILK